MCARMHTCTCVWRLQACIHPRCHMCLCVRKPVRRMGAANFAVGIETLMSWGVGSQIICGVFVYVGDPETTSGDCVLIRLERKVSSLKTSRRAMIVAMWVRRDELCAPVCYSWAEWELVGDAGHGSQPRQEPVFLPRVPGVSWYSTCSMHLTIFVTRQNICTRMSLRIIFSTWTHACFRMCLLHVHLYTTVTVDNHVCVCVCVRVFACVCVCVCVSQGQSRLRMYRV